MSSEMAPIRWEEQRTVPRAVAAVLASLRFSDPEQEALHGLSDREWNEALGFCDRAQLTLLLGHTARQDLPGAIRERIDGNRAANMVRDALMREALREIAGCLNSRGVEFLLLKGYSHGLEYGPAPRLQYDIDLFVPNPAIVEARNTLLSLDYEPLSGMAGAPRDHLPAMARKTGWQWRGDFFDPEIPPSVDLHFQFWDGRTERLDAPGVEEFWQRRVEIDFEGRPIAALDEVDRLCYASLHLLRHLLRGSLRVYHVYEIAHFLHAKADDEPFWRRWVAQHPPALRRLQAVPFFLAHRWFACGLPGAMQELSPGALLWMERHAAAPLEGLFHPNKAELWLHLSLLPRTSDRAAIVRRRLLPLRLPGQVDSVFVAEAEMTPWLRVRRKIKYAAHVASRVVVHARTMFPAAAQGMAWALGANRPFLMFLIGANLYNLGAFIFFLLYNLLLLDLGFDERFIGAIAGAVTAGTIAGTLPAAALLHRLGLQRLLRLACGGTAVLLAARAIFASPAAIALTAFAGGVFSGFWFVSLPVAVARLNGEGRRPWAFSVWIASGIASGIVGGLLGSRLPSWIAAADIASGAAAKRAAIAAGCGLILAALWPLARLALPAAGTADPRAYPNARFGARFLLVFGMWQLAIGAFNPFFNVYFSRRLRMPLEEIGLVFAGSQLAQAAAVLLAPPALKRVGLASGVAGFQAATAACLLLIAAAASPWSAALLYAGFMSFQAMAEPGLFTALLNRVSVAEQAGASALLFLVMFSCHAAAAPLAGSALAAVGYGRLLAGAAILAFCAALLSRRTLTGPSAAED